MSGFETQARIVHQSNQIRDEIKSIYEWEKDMKNKEAKRIASANEQAFDQSYPMRNQMQAPKPSSSPSSSGVQPSTSTAERVSAAPSASVEMPKRKPTIPNAIENADEFKKRGNDCVKQQQFQKAIHYYTEAIRLNPKEPVYYTNRALCYLKQSKFTECIDDCSTAIGLDCKAVKAYYRRMQAREHMQSDLDAALSDCKMILSIEPKNVEAQRGLNRLEQLVKPTTTMTGTPSSQQEEPKQPSQALWSEFTAKEGFEQIDFVSKPPHLRSKVALKRIAIDDSEVKRSPIPPVTESIETNRIQTTTTTTAMVTVTETSNIDQTKTATIKPIVTNDKIQPAKPTELLIPKNSAQFHKVWKSTTDNSQRFIILKGIYDADIGKMLGAQFSLEILREIFSVLKSQFTHQNLPIANILKGIVTNSQMPIVSVMMNAEDKLAFTKLVEYMRIRDEDAKLIETIQQTFDDLIAM